MVFYDFEVFKHDWLVVFIDMNAQAETVIHNDIEALRQYYNDRDGTIWVGFNNKHYDQYIFKGIMLGMDPKDINDYIIVKGGEGWQYSRVFNEIPMINYDVMTSTGMTGLKTLEGFLGSNIKETDVPFDIDRPLTDEELASTIKYCRHDVEETIKVFMEKIDDFNAMYGIVQAYPEFVSLSNIGDTAARITAKVLGCVKHDWDDEYEYTYEPYLKLGKYSYVRDWFEECKKHPHDTEAERRAFYKQSLTVDVAGIPHTFGFGGLHGAPAKPVHLSADDGAGYHVDVNNYYPSYLIGHGKVTRSATNDNYPKMYLTRKELKFKQTHAATKDEAKKWKKAQLPYKKMLNALSGAMKDKTNPAYDPRMNNEMCINGQLMLLDLIDKLEVIEGFKLVQSNTDGLIIWIPDTDEAFYQMDEICYEWEERCSTSACDIRLELDSIQEIFQKDVNNYLWIEADGSVERIGAYLKPLSAVDYDLPIINKALVDYMVKKVPVEDTILSCNELKEFQKLVKLSNKYECVRHNGRRYSYKCYRVFASSREKDGKILKCRKGSNPAKFGNTPDCCFINNNGMDMLPCPAYLDKQWYIDLAYKRLRDFGIGGR